MKDWTWPMIWALGIVAAAIIIMYALATDQGTRDQLIALFVALVGLIAGGAVGAGVGYYRGLRVATGEGAAKDWTWQMVWALGIVAAVIVSLFVWSPDQATRDVLIVLFESLVGLIVGVGAGAAVGWHVGWAKARASTKSAQLGTSPEPRGR